MESFAITDKNRITRAPQRGSYDHATVYQILDANFICTVGFVDGGHPVLIPMTYGRKDNMIYLHGASSSRLVKLLADNNSICINVTLIDGIVVARSMFDTSVNYRSVVLFGKAEMVSEDKKLDALECISECIIPGRWKEVRPPLPNELKATTILKVEIEEAAAKARSGPPLDDKRDLQSPIWAGQIPLKIVADQPIDDPALHSKQPVPKSVLVTMKKYPNYDLQTW